MRITRWQFGGLVAGVAAFVTLLAVDSPLHHHPVHGARPAQAAAVAALMAIWWLTEALPIFVTACVPLALAPILGAFDGRFLGTLGATAVQYIDPYIFLFAGGMCIAAAMQRWDLHRRIALTVMRLIGTDPRHLLFGFLAATAFISLWISNTATATMMVPIGMAMIAQLERQLGGRRLKYYGMAIMLSIAYAANIGGIGTKIGTAPNAQFAGFMERIGSEVSFLQFMAVGLPFVLLFLPVAWLALWRIGSRDSLRGAIGATAVADEIALLGPVKREEWIVLGVFAATVALWIAGKPITEALAPSVTSFKLTSAHVEGTIAMCAAIALMLMRSRGRLMLTFGALRTVPWETLLLLGGSFAMAGAVQSSGLSDWLGAQLAGVRDLPPFAQVLMASVATVALSAVASNTATIGIMLNVLKGAVSPSLLPTTLFAATIASSCDFALPAGTPPNAIVFGSGYVTIPQMARTGALLDIVAAIVAAAWCWLSVGWFF